MKSNEENTYWKEQKNLIQNITNITRSLNMEREIDLWKWSSWELSKFINSDTKREAYIGYEVKWGSISYPLLDKDVSFKPIELYPDLFFGFFEDRLKKTKLKEQLKPLENRGLFLVCNSAWLSDMEVGSEWTTFSHKSDRNKYEKIYDDVNSDKWTDEILDDMGFGIEDCYTIVEIKNREH